MVRQADSQRSMKYHALTAPSKHGVQSKGILDHGRQTNMFTLSANDIYTEKKIYI